MPYSCSSGPPCLQTFFLPGIFFGRDDEQLRRRPHRKTRLCHGASWWTSDQVNDLRDVIQGVVVGLIRRTEREGVETHRRDADRTITVVATSRLSG